MSVKYLKNFYAVYYILLSTNLLDGKVVKRSQVDQAVEDAITYKLADDLIQSVEKKFHVDLERSLDMVMTKIHILLQNGTQSTQDKFQELQALYNDMKVKAPAKTDTCMQQKDNETTSLSEKALHQMVVCGYALIGQDPAAAVNRVHTLKNMIREEVRSMDARKKGIYELLRVCGHEHNSLKKVIKCVISKSPILKSVLMSVTGKLINGVVELTKMLAHGAMHEACLIQVLKTAEEEAVEILEDVKKCVYSENSLGEIKDENERKTIVTREINNKSNSKSYVFADVKNDLNLLNTDPLRKHID